MFDIEQKGETIALIGRFDASKVDAAKEVFAAIDRHAVVDFSRLDYISSAGLGVLLATQKRLLGIGHGLKITHLNGHLREIFRIAGFDSVFDIE